MTGTVHLFLRLSRLPPCVASAGARERLLPLFKAEAPSFGRRFTQASVVGRSLTYVFVWVGVCLLFVVCLCVRLGFAVPCRAPSVRHWGWNSGRRGDGAPFCFKPMHRC